MTYDNDDEVKPTPRVSKVLLETICAHFNDHLAHEDHSKAFVHVLENHSQYFALWQLNVFNCLTDRHTVSRTSIKLRRVRNCRRYCYYN